MAIDRGLQDIRSVTKNNHVTDVNRPEPAVEKGCHDVTDEKEVVLLWPLETAVDAHAEFTKYLNDHKDVDDWSVRFLQNC